MSKWVRLILDVIVFWVVFYATLHAYRKLHIQLNLEVLHIDDSGLEHMVPW